MKKTHELTHKASNCRYLYFLKYDQHYSDLSKLESRQLFDKDGDHKILLSNVNVDPSISPFIKNSLALICTSKRFQELLKKIAAENIHNEGFNVEYLILDGDLTEFSERREKQNEVGHCIQGEPDFLAPTITFAICNYDNTWYFGVLAKHNSEWQKHKKKPKSFSNSISMTIAKTLVSMASKGNKNVKLLDGCCGVGTVMLEACFAGFKIEGCDINWKACSHSRDNLAHYNYTAQVHCSDIKDLRTKCDAIIIDLPYNLYSYSNEEITANIIASAAKLSDRVIIVSIIDIEEIIKNSGLKVTDFCTVPKKGKSKFVRNIWICEKSKSTD